MRKLYIIISALSIGFTSNYVSACDPDSARVRVINTSPYAINLETKDEVECSHHSFGAINPGETKNYCIKHNYLVRITTIDAKTGERKAVTLTDVWNDLIVTTPDDGIPDISIKHLRGDAHLLKPENEDEKIDWIHHTHGEYKTEQNSQLAHNRDSKNLNDATKIVRSDSSNSPNKDTKENDSNKSKDHGMKEVVDVNNLECAQNYAPAIVDNHSDGKVVFNLKDTKRKFEIQDHKIQGFCIEKGEIIDATIVYEKDNTPHATEKFPVNQLFWYAEKMTVEVNEEGHFKVDVATKSVDKR